ncbi:hypothetical protein NPIL_392671 [Nephila pilipes]|uniref:Uncharacterized protein n=1 Tax=Nephila pilipes TaxID=299642 RepID=A0A8X6UIR2_NEPPI|nr:hypothetical protein NPIL_392671 [Nephila pilipes]
MEFLKDYVLGNVCENKRFELKNLLIRKKERVLGHICILPSSHHKFYIGVNTIYPSSLIACPSTIVGTSVSVATSKKSTTMASVQGVRDAEEVMFVMHSIVRADTFHPENEPSP